MRLRHRAGYTQCSVAVLKLPVASERPGVEAASWLLMLADDPAGVMFRETILRSNAVERMLASPGGYRFLEATCARTYVSKDSSATSRRCRAFSRSKSFMLLA